MKKSKDLKSMLGVMAFSAVAIFVLHYFMYQDIKAKNEKISTFQYELSMRSEMQDYLISTERSLESLNNELNLAQTAFVPKEGEIKFIEAVENLARRNGLSVEIDALNVETQNFPSKDLTTLSLKARTTGSWYNTYMFLAELEALPLKLKITKTSLVHSGGDGVTPGSWIGTVEIKVLKYK